MTGILHTPASTVETTGNTAATARAELNRARDLGQTCSASRHVHTLLDDLLAGRIPQQLIDDPQHCAESIATVLAELWNRRRAMGYAAALRARGSSCGGMG